MAGQFAITAFEDLRIWITHIQLMWINMWGQGFWMEH